MAVRTLVVDVAEEGQQLGLQPTNVGGLLVTTGPEVVPIAALGGTYWVDNTYTAGSSDGSDERPFTTIAAGLAAIAAQVGFASGTLLVAGNPDYTGEGLIAVPDSITARIFAWGSPSQQPVSFSATCGNGAPLLYLRGCNVTLTLGDSIVQADMSSIVAVSNTGGSTLVMRGGSARLTSQLCRLSGSWDDAACSLMHVGGSEAVLDCISLRCDGCAVEGTSLTAATLEFRTTSFSTPIALDATTISMDRQSERSAAAAGARPSSLPVPFEDINPVFGSGITGDVTLAASTLLAQSDEFNNLTISATGRLRTENAILRVRNLLNLTNTVADGIEDYTGGTGGNAAGSVGGAAWGGVGGYSQGVGGSIQAPSGATGGKGAGAQPTAIGVLNACTGAEGGNGGAGGAGDGGGIAGGAARLSGGSITNVRIPIHYPPVFAGPSSVVTGGSVATAPIAVCGGHAGQAGSAGGGTAAGAGSNGGGGGGAGRPGSTMVIYARGIRREATTAAGCISTRGRNGGNGGNSEGGDAGGGGGGGGSGGGCVIIFYEWLLGTAPAADEVNAGGGTGGNGGNGTGTGAGGNGAFGGNGGQIVLINLLTGERRITLGGIGTAGNAAVGNAGGAGGAGNVCTADL